MDNGHLEKINEIIDKTIRPALQRDGGDLQVVGLDGKTLKIQYEGACGGCPHAAMGTLHAIQSVLRDEYDPEIVVEMA
jgi:NFU1 iron-sulfur cluster scaffold homolog, mitochondrial